MRIIEHNDEVIKSVKAFKNYNKRLSEVVSEDYSEYKDRYLEKPLYCGVFVAKIYIGNTIFGTYEFDCRHYRQYLKLDKLAPKIRRIK